MKIHAFSSLGIALAMFLTGPCAALPDTNREGKVQVPDLSVNPYAVTSVLDDAGSALNSRSNEPLDLGDRRKCYRCSNPCPKLTCCAGDLPQCAQLDGKCECRPKGG